MSRGTTCQGMVPLDMSAELFPSRLDDLVCLHQGV